MTDKRNVLLVQKDDDEYQATYDDEDDDERTIEEEEQLNSEDEQNELEDLEAVRRTLNKSHEQCFAVCFVRSSFRMLICHWKNCSNYIGRMFLNEIV